MSEPIKLTRQELYDLVWSEPVTKIGEKFGVSDVAIAKICKKMDIPRPPTGYWARKHHGYQTEKATLPDLEAETTLEYWLTPPDKCLVEKPNIEPPLVEVDEQLSRPHKAVKAIRADLRGTQRDEFGRIGRSDGPIHVSKVTYSRVCCVLDALFKTLEARGHSVAREDGKVCLAVDGERIFLAVSEPARRIELGRDKWGYRRWDFQPTGKLVLTLSGRHLQGSRRQWSDGKVQRLEGLLGRLIVTIEQAPSVIKAAKLEEECRARKWRHRELCRRREVDVVRYSHDRAVSIDSHVEKSRKAKQIREFVAEAEEQESMSASVQRKVRWARTYADHIDPFVDFRIEALDEEVSHPVRYGT